MEKTKICPHCNRPFSWRKKWEKNWEAVKYCSQRCRTESKSRLKVPSGGSKNTLGEVQKTQPS